MLVPLWMLTFPRILFSFRFREMKEQYDLKVHEATLLQERLQQSSHHKQLEEIQTLEASVGKPDSASAIWTSINFSLSPFLTGNLFFV